MDLLEISKRIQLLNDVIETNMYDDDRTKHIRTSLMELKSEVDHWVSSDIDDNNQGEEYADERISSL